MLKETLTVGTRIYNHGDMANASHFGTIIAIINSGYGTHYKIKIDDEPEGRRPRTTYEYTAPASMFCEEFKGHSGTRFVTETEYDRWHAASIAEMERQMRATLNRAHAVSEPIG